MKPVSLKLKNFGPFTEEQFIDFSELEKSGLFLIYGNTGSGKTTLLDAICCALYCSSSNGVRFGGKGKSTLEKMRCQQAKDNEPTYVEFIFDSKNYRYRFYREIRLNRGGVNFNEEHFCGRYNGAEFVPMDANLKMEKVNALAEDIIGLTADQFRQVVILPQGKFEELLTSKSEAKEDILSGIFNVGRWDSIVEKIKTKVDNDREELVEEDTDIKANLKLYDCLSVEELGEEIIAKAKTFKEKSNEKESLEKENKKLEKQKSDLEREDEQFKILDEKEKELNSLSEAMENSEQEEKALKRAEEALKIKPLYDKKVEAVKNEADAVTKRDEAKETAEGSLKKLEDIETQLEEHSSLKEANEEKKKLVTTYENAVGTYKTLDEKKKAFDDAVKVFEACEKKYTEIEKEHKNATETMGALSKAFEEADNEFSRLRKAYDENIGSVLAKKLEPGKPCPVCGSTSHPNPASHTGEEVSKEDVDNAEIARNAANDKYKKVQDKVEKLKENLDKANEKKQKAETAKVIAETNYNNAVGGKLEGIDTLKQLETEIKRMKEETEDYDNETVRLNNLRTDAVGESTSDDTLYKKAEKELAKVSKELEAKAEKWEEALAKSAFDNEEDFVSAQLDQEEIRNRRKALTTLEANYKKTLNETNDQKKNLEGKERPDLEAFKEIMQKNKTALENVSGEVTLLSDHIRKMKDAHKSLAKREEEYHKKDEKNKREKQFFDMIDGRRGIGIKRYVLGIMLDLVTNRANEMLSNIYNSRYRIRRSDRKAGREHNFGLAFEIEDFECGKCRSSSDISGGEKFLVSLSLAIGLSDVVRAQGSGIDLEAIFIDEGFGTLDKECLNDALYVLQSVKEKNGMVGVISHVDELAENITARIETTKTEAGSKCEIFYE